MTHKMRIKLLTIGYLPHDFLIEKIKNWPSEIFQLTENIKNFSLRVNSDRENWNFSDALIRKTLPQTADAAFVVALVNVPIEDNWYSRRISQNQIVITFHEIRDILRNSNIPLKNVVLRLLYSYALVYREYDNRIPPVNEVTDFTHDEPRGCIFDMNGIKTDLPFSCDKPQICEESQERLRKSSVSNDVVEQSKRETLKIRKEFYYRVLNFVKNHSVWALKCIPAVMHLS